MRVEVIDDAGALAGLRSQWGELLRATPGASFFQSCEWLELYWQHFAADQKLRVLVVEDGPEVRGIVPLVVRRVATRVGTLRYLTYPLDDWGAFYGPISGDPARMLEAALSEVWRMPRDWDVLELRWVDADSPRGAGVESALAAAGYRAYRHAWVEASRLDISQGYESYLKTRSKNWRKSRKKNDKDLATIGEVTHVRYRPRGSDAGEVDPRWDLYDTCERIAERSWQGSSVTGTTLSHPSIRPFLRDVHEAACRLGAADVNLLYVDGEPVAYDYGYHYAGNVEVLRGGYDATAGCDGAGSVLFGRWLEDSCRRGDHTIDLGAGLYDYKLRWQTSAVTSYRFTHFAGTALRAQLLNLNRWARDTFGNRPELTR